MKKLPWVLLGASIAVLYVGWAVYVSWQWDRGDIGEVGAFGDSFAFVAGLLNGAAVLAAIYGTALQRRDLSESLKALKDQAKAQDAASRHALDANILACYREISASLDLLREAGGPSVGPVELGSMLQLLGAAPKGATPFGAAQHYTAERLKVLSDLLVEMKSERDELARGRHGRAEVEAERRAAPSGR